MRRLSVDIRFGFGAERGDDVGQTGAFAAVGSTVGQTTQSHPGPDAAGPGEQATAVMPAVTSADLEREARRGEPDGSRSLIEASGGLTLASAVSVAATGVDFIAVGAITHSAPILDIAMDLV